MHGSCLFAVFIPPDTNLQTEAGREVSIRSIADGRDIEYLIVQHNETMSQSPFLPCASRFVVQVLELNKSFHARERLESSAAIIPRWVLLLASDY